jgi:chromate transport protein ChrA
VAALLKLGIIGFEVPAHISMMREEVVVKKKWLEEQHFLDLIATNLIPGPNSTEMAIHIGHKSMEGTNCRRLLFHSSCGTNNRNLCLAL